MRLRWSKASCLKHGSNQLIIKPWHFIKKLTILDVVTFLVTIKLHIICDHLLFCDVFENQKIRLILVVEVAGS